MSNITISEAKPGDCALILQFIKGLAEYEKALSEVETTEQDLRNALFEENPRAFALICCVDGSAAGFALYFYSYSTWTGKYGLFLEDLYIDPQYRGSGAGKSLLKHLARLAIDNNCGRFEWNVLDWNEPAIKFYESFGAQPQAEWVGYRLAGRELKNFANS